MLLLFTYEHEDFFILLRFAKYPMALLGAVYPEHLRRLQNVCAST